MNMPRIYDLYMENLGPLKVMTVIMALVSATVMSLNGQLMDLNANLMYIISIFSKWVWSGFFLAFAISRIINIWGRISNWYIAFLTSIFGIWLWSLMLASATIFTPIGGIDLMLVIPLFCELWILARTIEKKKVN